MKKLLLNLFIVCSFLYISNSIAQNFSDYSIQAFNESDLRWQKDKPIIDKSNSTDKKLTQITFDMQKKKASFEINNKYKAQHKIETISSTEINMWEKAKGPDGGYVTKFYNYFDSLYALVEREIYIYRTDKWEPLNFSTDGTTARCLFVDSTGNILVGTDFSLLITTNQGKNWKQFTGELSNTGIWQILNFDSNKLLVATNKGIFFGTTDDYVFTNINSDLSYVNSINLTEDKVLWATTYSGVYRATYPELNWTRLNLDTTLYQTVLINNKGTIYTNAGYYLCKSTDNGENWEYLNGFFTDIILEGDSDIIAMNLNKILRINENGVYWTSSEIDEWLTSTFIINEYQWYVGTSGSGAYIYHTIKDTFQKFSKGLQSTTIRIVEILKNNSILVNIDPSRYYLTADDGVTWTEKRRGYSLVSKQDKAGNLYVADNEGIIKSTDYGETWTRLNVDVFPYYIHALDVSDDGKIICGGSSVGEVYLSTDSGNTFKRIAKYCDWFVDAIGILNDGKILFQSDSLYLVTNYGEKKNAIKDGRLYALAIEQDKEGVIYLGSITTYSIYRSNDCLNWTKIKTPIDGTPLKFELDSLDNLYAFFGGTILKTQDQGESWIQLTNNFPSTSIWCYAMDSNGNLFCGTQEEGLFHNKIQITRDKGIIKSYNLAQNYPNPFNATTQIEYTLPTTSNVLIKIYDVLGREIETVVDEQKEEGKYRVIWNAAKYSSGIYFYQLQTGSFVETKKMILLK
jgi:photosystem II stability/assembly factor-like uncharacterized protein